MIFRTLFVGIGLVGAQTALPGVLAEERQSASLAIEVTNVRGNEGRLVMALYGDAKSFANLDESEAYAAIAIRPNGNKSVVRLDTVAPGHYAVVLFHDANNNDEFDFKGDNPLEGFGVSGAKHAFDEPNFRQARVEVNPGAQAVSVKMHYFRQ